MIRGFAVAALSAIGCVASGDQVVRFLPGVTRLTRTLEVTSAESGTVYVGAADGSTVISGGCELPPFEVGEKGVWRVKVPDGITPEQLWVGGRRAQRAVSPNGIGNYYHIRQNAFEEDDGTGRIDDLSGRAFHAEEKEVFPLLAGLSEQELHEVFVHAYFAWDTEWLRIRRVVPDRDLIVLTAKTKRDFFRWKKWQLRFKIENCRAALDAPGEWWFDSKAREILYLPRPGETADTVRAEVPVLERWVSIEGTPEKPVTDIVFSNLTFACAGHRMPEMLFVGQSTFNVGGSIEARNARRVHFRDCRFKATSRNAIWFCDGTREGSVVGCTFTDLGAGGVRIGQPYLSKPRPRETLAGLVTVEDSVFAQGGRIFPEGTAVDIDNAVDCRVVHNEILDFFYTGIHCDQSGATSEPRTYIAFNRIHDLGRGVMCDMGGIYLTGPERGSVVEGNVVSGVWSYSYTGAGGTGLYSDEKCTGAVFASNLVYRTKTSPVNQHYGWDNVFVNNILALTTPERPLLVRTRQEQGTGMVVSNNVFYWRGTSMAIKCPPRPGRRPADDLVFGSNLYWCPDGLGTNAFNGVSWESWRADGNDAGSAVGDPTFVDPKKGNFSMRDSSLARSVGFRPWDCTRAGARSAALRALAESFEKPGAVEIPEPKRYVAPADYRSGFEFIREGEPIDCGMIFVMNKGVRTAVAAARGDAHTGKGYVRIVDSAKTPGIYPYLETELPVAKESVTLSFALKYGKASDLALEWRENTVKCANGRFASGFFLLVKDGKMTLKAYARESSGVLKPVVHEIVSATPDVWLDCKLLVRLGKGSDGPTVELEVKTPDGRVERTPVLSTHPEFTVPNWFGFLCNGEDDAVYCLDDFEYHVK